jgi:hypothetical protein
MITIIVLVAILFFVMALFYCLQKGFNQVVDGLNAIHEQLREVNERKQNDKV